MRILLFSVLTLAVATALSDPADAADITMRVGHGYSAGQPQDSMATASTQSPFMVEA